jgi:hypothetical protein
MNEITIWRPPARSQHLRPGHAAIVISGLADQASPGTADPAFCRAGGQLSGAFGSKSGTGT